MLLLPTTVCAVALLTKGEPPIAYQTFKFGRHHYHMVKADLASPYLSTETVHSTKLTSVWNLIGKRRPIAAITGTFFAPKQQKAVADILVKGSLVARGSRGTSIGVDRNGDVSIFDNPFGHQTNWDPYQFGLRGAVRVVTKGVVRPNPKWQRFRDRRIWGRAARTGVGLTTGGKLIFVATRDHVTLSQLGKAMRSRGVFNGVSLDGGSSTCLYYRGNFVVKPGRKLCNLLVIGTRDFSADADANTAKPPNVITTAIKKP